MNNLYQSLITQFSRDTFQGIEEVKHAYLDYKHNQDNDPEKALRNHFNFERNQLVFDESPLKATFLSAGNVDLVISFETKHIDKKAFFNITNSLDSFEDNINLIDISIRNEMNETLAALSYSIDYGVVMNATKNLKLFEQNKDLFKMLLSYVGSHDIKEKVELLKLVHDFPLDSEYSIIVVDLLSQLDQLSTPQLKLKKFNL